MVVIALAFLAPIALASSSAAKIGRPNSLTRIPLKAMHVAKMGHPMRRSLSARSESDPSPVIDVAPRMSEALPFLKRPSTLDGSMVGDFGFDPLELAKDRETLTQYRLAEIKHARLAMLAAAAWPLQELGNPYLAEKLNLPSLVAETGGRSPSVLNGGLEQVSAAYWTAVVLLTIVIETLGNDSWGGKVQPGDYGFDPLNLMPKDQKGASEMRLQELNHGRMAMMAILGFVVQEFVRHSAVVDQTPLFFKPAFGLL
ncbi:hypothetical protein AAMO2058_000030200 [Amorphochlora amoebiformis]